MPHLYLAQGEPLGESLIEGAKTKHTQREGLYALSIRFRGVGQIEKKRLRLKSKEERNLSEATDEVRTLSF